MTDQIPRSLDVVTVLDFEDESNHYLQSWRGQLYFREGEIINLLGDVGISECRLGRYIVHYDEPASQLRLNSNGTDVFHKFYKCHKLEE